MNNDTEVLHSDWSDEAGLRWTLPMRVRWCTVLYPDGRRAASGICSDPVVPRFMSDAPLGAMIPATMVSFTAPANLSAVTGACLALRRETFLSLGGMEERLAVAWNDVDLVSLRVRAAGLRVLDAARRAATS